MQQRHVTSSPRCITSSPRCVTSSPRCITSSPRCITSSPGCATSSPHCITSSPRCITSSPRHITSSPRCVVKTHHCPFLRENPPASTAALMQQKLPAEDLPLSCVLPVPCIGFGCLWCHVKCQASKCQGALRFSAADAAFLMLMLHPRC